MPVCMMWGFGGYERLPAVKPPTRAKNAKRREADRRRRKTRR